MATNSSYNPDYQKGYMAGLAKRISESAKQKTLSSDITEAYERGRLDMMSEIMSSVFAKKRKKP